ncbi:pre-toxin TG domain-containing protein [Metabacillus sp. 84]|uniref:pre-toxin TG domain-containing protein n=1 Tax=Metabacillus sp. 84 TaxID=3404705 RepID=UPI003CF5C21F
MENGVAVNPKGYKETGQGKGNKENKFLKFAKINERSIAKVVPKGKFVKKKFDWGEHFRHSAEVTLNSNPATMGLQDQVKMLTGHDLLTFKKVSDLERKQSASAWVDGIPIASNIKSAVEVNSGVNTITGEKLSGFDKAAAAITIVGGAYTRPIKPGIKAVKTVPKQFVRKADDVVGRVDKETGAVKALNKGMDSSIQYGETGGRNISPEQFFKEEAIAEEMYEKFRNLGTEDVNAIAKNSGFSVARIQRIKDHVFNNSHIKDHGVGRFDPDYELGQAWQRLIDGKQVDADIQLLHHEIFDSKFEGIFQTNYRTAHDKTIESGRPWNWEKNYEE